MEEEKLIRRRQRAKVEHNHELLGNTLKKLGELYHSQGRYEEALETYEEERELWTTLGKSMQAAVANRMIGEIHCTMGEYKEALRKLKEYFDVASAETNLIEEQRALATIGRTYFCMADSLSSSSEMEYKRALREAKQAYLLSLKICEKINNIDRYELLQMRSRLMLNMGLVFECEGNIQKAVEHVEKAISINKKADLYEDTFRCYASMAALYQRQKNSVLSLKYHDLALEVAERLPEKIQFMCETLSSKADVYFSVTNYRAAKQTLIKAYRMCDAHSEDRSLIERNLKIAHVLCDTEEKLTKIKDDDHSTMKKLYEIMGDACCVVKNFNHAIKYYLKMLESCEALGLCGKELLPALISLSQTYRDAGMFDESLNFLRKELEVWDDNPEETCKTSLNIVQLLEQKGVSYNEIMENLKKCHEYALIANNEQLELKVLKHMFHIQEKYDYKEAASETKSKIEVINADASSSCSEEVFDVDDEVDTPDIINNLSLSDILEDTENSNMDTSRSRQPRRQPQMLKIRRNEKGETQLQVACIAGNFQRVKQLIELKHPVNVTDNGGWTPLHEVCNHGHEELVELLLDHGANINDPGGDGCEGVTPLHDACSNGHLGIVQILLDRGACIDVRTNENKTPLDFLMEWSARTGVLSQRDAHLFESIKDRLKSGLEKAGLHTESAQPISKKNVSSIQHSTEREKVTEKTRSFSRSSVETPSDGKRRWSVLSSESSCSECSNEDHPANDSEVVDDGDENNDNDSINDNYDISSESRSVVCSPALIDENPALEYQKIMKVLRKKQIQEPKKHKRNKKDSVLIEDSEVVDDWLIDDLKDSARPNKRRKMRDADKGGAKLIGTLRKDVLIGKEDTNGDSECRLMNREDILVESGENTQTDIQISNQHSHDNSRRHIQQSSLLNCGFSCVTPNVVAQQSEAAQPIAVENEGKIHTVKVCIEDTSLVVPISTNESSTTLTVDWLAKEAARRFSKFKGKEPILMLLTKDGATLVAEDPITVVNSTREVTGLITGWRNVSLMQRYVDICGATNNTWDQQIQNCLQECDVTHNLNLSNHHFYMDKLTPLLEVLQHEQSLKELLLGGNALMSVGIKMLAKVKLPLLEVLDLCCNNVKSQDLVTLYAFFSHCQSLKALDLSFNDFEDPWLESMNHISEYLKSLKSLNLQSCGMVGDEFTSWKEVVPALNGFQSVEVLNISDNPLGECGVRGFLNMLKVSHVRSLNLGATALITSKTMTTILDFFRRNQPVHLRFLDLSDSYMTDSELMNLLRFLEPAEHFNTLVLCNNCELSVLSAEALFNMQKVPNILDLCGCEHLFTSYDEEAFDQIVNVTFVKKLSCLSLTCNRMGMIPGSIHWTDKLKERWKQVWGDKAKVLFGPAGLLKLNVV